MAVPKTPLSFIGFFFFLFTIVASQSMNAGVFKSRGGTPGGKACLIALDLLGPGFSCGDRLRNAEVLLNVRKVLRSIQDLLKARNGEFLSRLSPEAKKYIEDLEDLVVSKLTKVREQIRHLVNPLDAPAKQDPSWDVLEVLANGFRDCMSWCESNKDTEGISCATKSSNIDTKGLYCFLLA